MAHERILFDEDVRVLAGDCYVIRHGRHARASMGAYERFVRQQRLHKSRFVEATFILYGTNYTPAPAWGLLCYTGILRLGCIYMGITG